MTIEELPVEIQCSILRLLDPVSLIAISQTNSHFRRLVDPQRRHFVERLLAQECAAENGGLHPIFRARDNLLSPAYSEDEWSDLRWACTGCMRLLHHRYFDNHMILRLRYRKPVPGSAILGAVSTWESDPRLSFSSIQKQKTKSPDDVTEETTLRRRYAVCVTSAPDRLSFRDVQECGMPGFQGLTTAQFNGMAPAAKQQLLDDNALDYELTRCGSKRHLRKCLECRYIAGQLKPRPDGSGGSLRVPMIASRAIWLGSTLDRCFPRIHAYLDAKKPAFNAKVHPVRDTTVRERLWSLFMFRCPGCTRWKEVRELGKDMYPAWRPLVNSELAKEYRSGYLEYMTESFADTLRCNACYAKANGRQKLVEMLLSRILSLIDNHIELVLWRMEGEWQMRCLETDTVPKQYLPELKRLQERHPGFEHGKNARRATDADIAGLKQRLELWKGIWHRMKLNGHTGWATVDLDEWSAEWARDVDECEITWKWLKACKAEVEAKPDLLADWALSENGTSVSNGAV
ncbi:hypothetical protein BGZ63DRAFT_389982 [Mariannaea sp. PMI_226]|nr:hypothetical protein BGZ63DRAFT_389982 [Mariannaea sp. PMI_226]